MSDGQNTNVVGERFTTTHWSVVLAAGGTASQSADVALEKLCRNYWYPLYAFARRSGQSEENAKDLTQSFFARLLREKVRPTGPARARQISEFPPDLFQTFCR